MLVIKPAKHNGCNMCDMQNVIISLTPLHDGSENSTDGAENQFESILWCQFINYLTQMLHLSIFVLHLTHYFCI